MKLHLQCFQRGFLRQILEVLHLLPQPAWKDYFVNLVLDAQLDLEDFEIERAFVQNVLCLLDVVEQEGS